MRRSALRNHRGRAAYGAPAVDEAKSCRGTRLAMRARNRRPSWSTLSFEMTEKSFPVYQATNDIGPDDSADVVAALIETNISQTARRAPALGKGQGTDGADPG